MHKILKDFEIPADQLISARWPEQVIVKENEKENLPNSRLCHLGRPLSIIKEKGKREKYLELVGKPKKAMEYEGTSVTNWTASLSKETGKVESQKSCADHPN